MKARLRTDASNGYFPSEAVSTQQKQQQQQRHLQKGKELTLIANKNPPINWAGAIKGRADGRGRRNLFHIVHPVGAICRRTE